MGPGGSALRALAPARQALPPRYGLRLVTADSSSPFIAAIAAGLRSEAPDLPAAVVHSLAVTIAARLAPSTWHTYASAFTRFVRFCASVQLNPLPASAATVLQYVDFLSQEGRLQASTVQPYLSAINTLHEQIGFPKPAVGVPLASFLRGWQRQQFFIAPLPSEGQLKAMPAAFAQTMLDRVPLLESVVALRAALFFLLSFVTMLRPDSLLSCLLIQGQGGVLTYAPLRFKTAGPVKGQARQVDISRLPFLAAGIGRFERLKGDSSSSSSSGGSVSWWQLPGEQPPTTSHAEGWFSSASRGALIPPSFTLYSLRRGAASTALAVGVPLARIEFMGGWAEGSSALRRHYLDHSFPNNGAAQLFFGWLLSGALPVAVHANAFHS